MGNKKCRKCGIVKPISEFYLHPKMLDGHLNICKDCIKEAARERYNKNTEQEGFYEKERKRGREKYKRLYAGRVVSHIHKENSDTRKKFISRGIDVSGKELHHWNYNMRDAVFILTRRQHKLIHKHLRFDEQSKMFRYQDTLLDTLEKHKNFIEETIKERPVYIEL